MKKSLTLFILSTLFICSYQSLTAQVKKTKPKQKSECEKKLDSLQTTIQNLGYEKAILNSNIDSLTKDNIFLTEKLKSNDKLFATNIKIVNSKTGKPSNSQSLTKAKDVDKTTIRFEILGNGLAVSGSKTAYIVLFDDKNKIIGGSGKKFKKKESNDTEIAYSSDVKFNYSSTFSDKIKSDIKHNKALVSGNYKIEIYIEGSLSGFSEFSLE